MDQESDGSSTNAEQNGPREVLPLAPTESLATVDLTTELRWFIPGPLPADVEEWFTRGGLVGFSEARCDFYRVDGLADIGVKRRFGAILELKFRLGPVHPFELPPGVGGNLEIWQRWSPADGIVDLGDDTEWQTVDKRIVKRRFDHAGHEITITEENRWIEGVGCDAEIVAIVIDGQPSWSFAFAAFGPLEHHVDLVLDTWNAVLAATPGPANLRLGQAISCGYPEYLTRSAGLPSEGSDEAAGTPVGQ